MDNVISEDTEHYVSCM